MRKYSEYKYSGVKWIEDIPKHWGIVELKRLTKFNPQRREELDKETLVGYAPMDKVRSDMLAPLSIQMKNLSTGLTYFEEGDVVMAKVTPCFENGNVAIVPKMVHYCGYGSSELFVYRCNEEKLKSRLLLYYMLSAGFVSAGVSSMTGTGGLKRVSPTFARNVRIPLPPLAEQRAIVSYLDGKVGQIDTYIAKQTQQIELLKELKQAVIANAVTKGIDNNPNVKRQQSGVNWLGEIPEHWEVSKLRKHFIPRIQKVSDKDYEPLSVTKDGILPQLDTACKTDNGENRKLVRKGDYVVNSRSDRKGSGGISPFDGSVSLINIVIYPIDGEQEYFHYLFRSNNFVEEFYRNGRGIVADLWTTRYQEMKNIEIPIPPLSEQRAIVSYIEAKTASINKLIDAYEQQVERIKEYKQRLISDAVTGKINVTGKQTQTN